MNHLRDHIREHVITKPKSSLKPHVCNNKKKGIKSLIASSFQVANKITTEKKTRTFSELRYAEEEDEASEEDEEKHPRALESNLSKSISVATFKKLQSRRRIRVVAVFPEQESSQHALQDLHNVCKSLDTELTEIKFENLDFGEYNVLDTFYNADVCVVDVSVFAESASLFYHMGVRESTGMKDNMVIVVDESHEKTNSLKLTCTSHLFFAYQINADDKCIVTTTGGPAGKEPMPRTLYLAFQKNLRNVQGTTKAKCKEIFLRDLRIAMESKTGPELKQELDRMKKVVGEPALFTSDIILSILYSYRNIQDYDSMIQIVEGVPEDHVEIQNKAVQQLYAFALNRRGGKNDRDKALKVALKLIKDKDQSPPDLLCLAGRIYKDKYYDSVYTDSTCRDEAIKWYKTSFELQPSDFSGVNLAILLIAAGHELSKSEELQRVCMTLNGLIGRRGRLQSLTEYWIVGRFILISVLAQDSSRACLAAEKMFKLNPPAWYLRSIVKDLMLLRNMDNCANNLKFNKDKKHKFWVEYIWEASKEEEITDTRFPVLILDPGNDYVPSYVTVNVNTEESQSESVQLWHASPECNHIHDGDMCKRIHSWSFPSNEIRGMSTFKKDPRCLFLYVHTNSDDFQLFFCTPQHRKRFHDLVSQLSNSATILDRIDGQVDAEDQDELQYEYEYEDDGQRVVLGRGSFGVVYAARDISTNVKLAVKEIPERDTSQVQPLHEEIALHRAICHKNIVCYITSRSESGYCKIFMEQVPGGSLSSLIREKWGPLIDNESAMSFYTQQIIEGVRYLHGQKIVHRDIKGDNVLVNTYSGCCKLSDFGTSKRLAGINPHTKTFAGTMQFMAPEVIDQGQRGYGPPADIWSIGCTVVEMATGKPPFFELEPEAAIFKVGMFKTHPDIPEVASEDCVKFLKRCFDPNPAARASADDLLLTPFIVLRNKKKKKKDSNLKVQIPPQRLISDPGVPASSSPPSDDSGVASNQSESPKDLVSSNMFQPEGAKTPDMSKKITRKHKLFPRVNSEPVKRHPMDSPMSDSTNLLFSSHTGSNDDFYMVNQEHERKSMLLKSMKTHKRKICEKWMGKVEELRGYSCIGETGFNYLLEALIEYLEQPNNVDIKSFIGPIQRDHGGEESVLRDIQIAFLVVAECISDIVKEHLNVLPHWMFAIDNLIRTAVKRTIDDVNSEMKEAVCDASDAGSVTGAGDTTPISERRHVRFLSRDSSVVSEDKLAMISKVQILSDENAELMYELADLHASFNKLLQSNLVTYNTLVNTYSKLNEKPTPDTTDAPNELEAGEERDEALPKWLKSLNVPDADVEKFSRNHCTLSDVQNLLDLDDLKDLKISIGPRARIWSAMRMHRENVTAI
ncbi:mitogen-activated protein kinase kinase kinase 15-like isoform X2 [Hydractinia symbiolongicarpus]|uniref:mitogen-activated protein kinase kinase kinase 15-like isoform X2 n=1 Tax=Hydractinia symbiolongicarpus TaxID=13093 RepID=UPI00254E0C8B|nr:mitogen-activated protein kinase kinase kinase 15-like isoform X2 [Hydractinia symbiolongicarpus]